MKKFFIASICVFLASCGSNTAIVNSWRDPDNSNLNEQFKKVLVVALVKDEATRRTTENRLVSRNPIFHSSYQYLNGTDLKLTQEQKMKILKDENFDGVVTMRLVDTKKETSYVPGTNTSMYYGGYGGMYGGYGGGIYGGFGGWYNSYSSMYYDPGYYQETTYYMVETNIFSLKQDKLIWTGTTKSSNVIDLGTTIDEIAEAVKAQMKLDGSIPKK